MAYAETMFAKLKNVVSLLKIITKLLLIRPFGNGYLHSKYEKLVGNHRGLLLMELCSNALVTEQLSFCIHSTHNI